MNKQKLLWCATGGVFLILDRSLKWLALRQLSGGFASWRTGWRMWGRWLGWRPFLNPGVAFGIPVPRVLMIVLSMGIIGGLIWWLVARPNRHTIMERAAILAIALGAVSNLYDRVVYGSTVDYFQILTGVFNIADFLILLGFFLLWREYRKKT